MARDYSFCDVTLHHSALRHWLTWKLRGDDSELNHGLRVVLSHSTAIHTDDIWYLSRVADSDKKCT